MSRSHIENDAAYQAAIEANIRRNAAIGRQRRWRAACADWDKLSSWAFDNAERGNRFAQSLADRLLEFGDLSPAQCDAIRANITRAAERRAEQSARDAQSQHVGAIGTRQTFEATLERRAKYESAYGLVIVQTLRDAGGNLLIYKGKDLHLTRGDMVRFDAGIKSHDEYRGAKQTRLCRITKLQTIAPAQSTNSQSEA